MSEPGPVRLAIVGVGLIGRRHLAVAANEPACKVVAAADPFTAARLDVERHGAVFYSDYRAMLNHEQLDAVIIATPNNMHVTVGLDCVAAGLPILVEKPFSDTLAEGRRLLGAATAAGVSIAVGHHRRFDPAIESARALLAEGAIGTLSAVQLLWALRKHDCYYDTSWRVSRDGGGGPGLINLIHDVDLLRHLAGDITRVYAELGRDARGLEVEDTISATLRFDSGVLGSVLCSDATPSPWGWEQGSGENPDVPQSGNNCIRLLGTEGALALPRLTLYRHDQTRESEWRRAVLAHPLAIGPRSALGNQLAHFCAVVRGEEVPRVDGADGLATVATTLAIIQSGQCAEAVQVETF